MYLVTMSTRCFNGARLARVENNTTVAVWTPGTIHRNSRDPDGEYKPTRRHLVKILTTNRQL